MHEQWEYVMYIYWGKCLNESLHSIPSNFSTPHVKNFFQITINGRFNEIFTKLDRLSLVKQLKGDYLLTLYLKKNFVPLML